MGVADGRGMTSSGWLGRVPVWLLLVFLSLAGQASEPNMLNDVKELRWSQRVILVFAANAELAEAAGAELTRAGEAVDDREIAWFVVEGESVATNYSGGLGDGFVGGLWESYMGERRPVPVEVLLIGKDGGVKDRRSELELESILGQIDQMPMRRREMRER